MGNLVCKYISKMEYGIYGIKVIKANFRKFSPAY